MFYDEVNAFSELSAHRKKLYYGLLNQFEEFKGFFAFMKYRPFFPAAERAIRREFSGKICEATDLRGLISGQPVELACALALIGCNDYHSVTPPWLTRNYPQIEYVVKTLRGKPCKTGCPYCREAFGIHRKLKEFFGFDQFRSYGGEPLQERAVQAAVDGKSLLAVFPTGGGKSITFQLPALMAGQTEHGLTVVISPLQSLMKDRVDNLSEHGLVDAVTVNGLLSPVERAEALERVANGLAAVFYISPEQLRSRTIEKLLLSRNVVRFVIDEAHCFSAWGQDFRVDYLYIGDFIRELQIKKGLTFPIPVSCFTATAKQKVISDIRDYFQDKLGMELELFTSAASRENLRYVVLHQETEADKYNVLGSLIEQKDCPTIVYVSRTRRTRQRKDPGPGPHAGLPADLGGCKARAAADGDFLPGRSRGNVVALANALVHSIETRMKAEDIRAIRQENGVVQIVRHTGRHLEQPVVEQIIKTYRGGKACVLTNTNEEALRVLGLLTRHGIRAKLIQSMDGFRLYDLAEIRFFLKVIDRRQGPAPVISDIVWNDAKNQLQTAYHDSACLENCLNLIADFERVNSYGKYRSDLEEFIRSSQYEDFYSDDQETIFVSTIHKAKGREFDSVYLLLNRVFLQSGADRRKLYVGLTRAKDNLYIHCNTDIFDAY